MRNTILVTGANGLLGSHIIEQLLQQGNYVKGILRKKHTFKLALHPNLTLVECDFYNKKVLQDILKNCDAIIHTAAITSQNLLTYAPYKKINVEATKILIQNAIQQQVRKFIFVSTANTIPNNDNQQKAWNNSFYIRSKIEAEKMLLNYTDQIDVVIANPTFLIGKYGDIRGSNRIVYTAMKYRILLTPCGGKNFVSAKEVAIDIIKLLQHGKNNNKYLISGINYSYKEFYKQTAMFIEKKPVYLVIPKCVLCMIGVVGETFRMVNIPVEISLTNMRILGVKNFYYDSNLQKRQSTSLQIAIQQAIKWIAI